MFNVGILFISRSNYGVILYGELLLKKAAIYGGEIGGEISLESHKDINLLG
jgi:hypothetical protein